MISRVASDMAMASPGFNLFLACIILGGLLLCILLVVARIARKAHGLPPTDDADPAAPASVANASDYVRSKFLLTAAEYSFYKVLNQVIGPDRITLIKVRVADLVEVRDGLDRSAQTAARNRINKKHIDFVICDRVTCVPLVCIELDDRSHDRPERQTRDAFVDAVFGTVGLPLIRQPAQRGYELPDLRRRLAEAVPAFAGGLPPSMKESI